MNFLTRFPDLQLAARHFANRVRSRRRRFDAIAFAVLLVLAVVLRVWNLGDKAIWLDEWLSAFIANGYGLGDLPLDRWLASGDLFELARPHPDASLARTLTVLNTESTHPPLFFVLQHFWLQYWSNGRAIAPDALPIALRTFPAICGVFQAIAAFFVGKLAFSPRVGLLAAGLTATSPLAVYLSQEARHYTLAMACFVLALRGLLAVVRRWQYGDLRARKAILLWIVANSFGLYAHYLYVFAFIAQAIAVGLWLRKTQQWRKRRRFFRAVVPGFVVPLMVFAPWIWVLAGQIQGGETTWAQPFEPQWFDVFSPIAQTLVGMLSAFVVLPIEGQPQTVAIGFGAIALLAGTLLAIVVWIGWQRLLEFASASPESARIQERRLLVVTIGVAIVVQMLAAFYFFGRNLTIAPRYHAIYYPCLCLVVAIGLGGHPAYRPPFANAFRHLPVFGTHWRRSLVAGVLALSAIGAVFAIQNLAFQKGYTPRAIAANMQAQSPPAATPSDSLSGTPADTSANIPTNISTVPAFTVATYENLQEVALGWSILWELARQSPDNLTPRFALLDRSGGYESVWMRLARDLEALDQLNPNALEFDLWAIAPGLRQAEFPEAIGAAGSGLKCALDPDRYDRVGVPYQGYRCTVGS
ncbi:MAG: hypothetical protein ACFB9N_09625 [Geitlerinemataceae cyanobacterium]